MCNERERLIGYVYDDCDAGERAAIARHLEECEACRHEIGALRGVRHDLLAWEVPEHAPVWRPFAPPRVRASWRDIPAWAMAAAASLMFVAGAAGGVLTHVLWPHESATTTLTQLQAPARLVPASIPVDALDARDRDLEQRLIAMLRAELAEQSHSARPVAAPAPQLLNARWAEVETMLDRQKLQDNFNASVYRDVLAVTNRLSIVEKATSNMAQQVSGGAGIAPNRY